MKPRFVKKPFGIMEFKSTILRLARETMVVGLLAGGGLDVILFWSGLLMIGGIGTAGSSLLIESGLEDKGESQSQVNSLSREVSSPSP